MMKAQTSLAIIALLATPSAALAQTKQVAAPVANQGSAYLQCDGNPNNMSAGEGIARFVGAVTLLGLFAPAVESANPALRKFGDEGVAACSLLIDGAKAEGNVARRLPLLLARALHHIEAKNYSAALADAARARTDAAAAGYAGDIYFERSLGRSIDRVEAAALARMGQIADAKIKALSKTQDFPASWLVQGTTDDYFFNAGDVIEAEINWLKNSIKILNTNSWVLSARLQYLGRFAEAAQYNEAYLRYLGQLGYEEKDSETIASTAVVQALAGNWPRARELANLAQSNFDDRRSRGKPDTGAADIIEILDLFKILELADKGDMKTARLKFAGRSEWLSVPAGQFIHVNKMLRKGAQPSELYGSLAITPEAYIADRKSASTARILESDKDNRTLFNVIVPYANVDAFERLSGQVWKTNKSKLLGKEATKTPNLFYIEGRHPNWQTRVDAMLLHSALLAKSRGKTGFIFWTEAARQDYGFIRFGNPGEAGIIPEFYLDADAVIAELRQAIPSPDELKLRKAKRKK